MKKPAKSAVASIGPQVRSGEANLWDTVAFAELFGRGYTGNPRSDLFRLAVSLICIDVKSQDVSKTPLYLRRIVKGGSEIVERNEHPVAKMLAGRPNKYMGIKEWLRIAAAHLVTAQQYYVAVQRTRGGELVQVQGIPHTKINRRINVMEERYVYDVMPGTDHEQIQWGWARKLNGLLEDQISHIRLRSMNGFDPLSNDMVGAAAFSLVANMAEYQDANYRNGGVPALAFRFPEGLTDVQFARLNKDLNKATEDLAKKRKPIILEGSNGTTPEVERLSEKATDGDFMKSQTQAMLDVLRVYRVPPHKAFVFESVKYDNLDAMERLYVDDSLVPLFDALEEGLNQVLLTEDERDEFYIAFDREAAYAMDPAARQKITESMWTKGMISKNEMRERNGYNRIPGEAGDVYCMSGNFVLTTPQNEPVLVSGGNTPDSAEDDAEDEKPAKKPEKSLRLVS